MNFYAQPRMTRDIDIVVALGVMDKDRIYELFHPDYYVPEDDLEAALRTERMFNLVHYDSSIKIDVIVRKSDDYRLTEFERRQKVELTGFQVWTVSKEDLILSKLVWAKDSGSELQRRDVRNLLASGADMAYVNEWAPRLGVAELLNENRNE